jgi:hypothetical protein
MRTSSATAATLLLAACGGGDGSGSQASAPAAASATTGAAMASEASVSCAVGGAQAFAGTCTLERAQVEGAPILVIRHADGAFRRFAVKDGALTEADGAEKAVVTRSGDTIDVAVGSDRYRLSASQLGNGQ